MGVERRLHPRAVVRLAAQLRSGPTAPWCEVLILDLSAGGAGVRAGVPLESGAQVSLRFRVPAPGQDESEPIEVRALMVRAEAVVPPDRSRPYHYGLHFLDLHGDDCERVGRFVWGVVHGE